MAKNKTAGLSKNELKKAIKKAYKEKFDDIIDEKVAPITKKVLQKHVKEEVVDTDFVDKNGKYRKYRVIVGGRMFKARELGHSRTQKKTYKNMSDDKYNIATPANNGNFEVYNIFPPGDSIFNTPIKEKSDPLLYTKWLVDGNIVMPTLEFMNEENWKIYCKDPANRYEARPFVKHTMEEISSKEIQKEIGDAIAEELLKEISKNFK